MNLLLVETKKNIKNICSQEQLQHEIGNTDIFPSTQNDEDLSVIMLEKAKALNLDVVKLKNPFPWSEDFAQFSQQFKSVIFGLGAGENIPKLHNAN
jgi:metal-dependent amidase/aminoacylase/carboxypeptidase family protein